MRTRVTTQGYRKGAKTYAEDRGVTLLVLREFRPEDWEGRIREIPVKMEMTFLIGPAAKLHPVVDEGRRLAAMGFTPPFIVDEADVVWADEFIYAADGSPIEPILPALAAAGATTAVGTSTIDFDPPRWVSFYGEHVGVHRLEWTIEEQTVQHRFVAGRGLGEPRLLVVDAVGADLDRALFQKHLERLSIAPDGEVTERVRLSLIEAGPDPDAPANPRAADAG